MCVLDEVCVCWLKCVCVFWLKCVPECLNTLVISKDFNKTRCLLFSESIEVYALQNTHCLSISNCTPSMLFREIKLFVMRMIRQA